MNHEANYDRAARDYDNMDDTRPDVCDQCGGIDVDLIDNIKFSGIDWKDYPDFCDAYIESAEYDGREMTEEELDYVMDKHRDFVHEKLWNHIF